MAITWGGITFTGYHHLALHDEPDLVYKDVNYARATGRDLMILGSQQNNDTSLAMLFSEEEDRRNCLVGATRADLEALILTIRNKRLSSNPFGTLSFPESDGLIPMDNMLLAEFVKPRIVKRAHPTTPWQATYRALFVQYV